MLEHATELEIDQSFRKVSTGDYGDPLILLEEDIVNSLSTDQAFDSKMVQKQSKVKNFPRICFSCKLVQ